MSRMRSIATTWRFSLAKSISSLLATANIQGLKDTLKWRNHHTTCLALLSILQLGVSIGSSKVTNLRGYRRAKLETKIPEWRMSPCTTNNSLPEDSNSTPTLIKNLEEVEVRNLTMPPEWSNKSIVKATASKLGGSKACEGNLSGGRRCILCTRHWQKFWMRIPILICPSWIKQDLGRRQDKGEYSLTNRRSPQARLQSLQSRHKATKNRSWNKWLNKK